MESRGEERSTFRSARPSERVLDWRREEQAGAGRLQEVEGCLAPLYVLPPGMLRVLDWRQKEQAVGRVLGEGEMPEDGAEARHPRGQGLGQLGPG